MMNVCSLGWVIESNSLRSVTSVSLSFPLLENLTGDVVGNADRF